MDSDKASSFSLLSLLPPVQTNRNRSLSDLKPMSISND
jgi:hypothetical protein